MSVLVLREIQEEDQLWKTKNKKAKRTESVTAVDECPTSKIATVSEDSVRGGDTKVADAKTESHKRSLPGFY